MGLEMDMALDFMGDLGKFLEAKEDTQLLDECNKVAEKVIEDHIDVMEELNEEFLEENL